VSNVPQITITVIQNLQPVPELPFYKHHLTFLSCFVNILVPNNTAFNGVFSATESYFHYWRGTCTNLSVFPPTDAQLNYLKNSFKVYIKIDIKTALTRFGAIIIITEHII
jgi:hypothetical protein